MGDRGSVYVKDGETGVYIYSHWGGYRLLDSVARHLARDFDPWADYFARRLFIDLIADGLRSDDGARVGREFCTFDSVNSVDSVSEDVALALLREFFDARSWGISATPADSEYGLIAVEPATGKVGLGDDLVFPGWDGMHTVTTFDHLIELSKIKQAQTGVLDRNYLQHAVHNPRVLGTVADSA